MSGVSSASALLEHLFQTALAAVSPSRCLPEHLQTLVTTADAGRTIVVGAGKGAAAMALAVEEHWDRWGGGQDRLSGLVVTRYGHAVVTHRIKVVEAAHPVPDAAGEAAARNILDLVGGLTADDRVLVLLSGGGSALLALPAPGVTLEQKRAVTRQLLTCGATIKEINCVRKHLSAIKGGRLALAAAPARVTTLAISDVAGDDPAVIASGPTVADPTTCAEALAILERYSLDVPASVRELLISGSGETPKPGDARLAGSAWHLVAHPRLALVAAAEAARAAGITPLILGDRIEGEAREVARALAGIALSIADHGLPVRPPCVLLSGGETTVTVKNPAGRGGRNSEFLLALALALHGHPRIQAIACDTDGIDGSEDNAGAVVGPETLARAGMLGVDAKAALAENGAYDFFSRLGDLVMTGPTRTNVNDFRAILVEP